jgi:hypothetical protein
MRCFLWARGGAQGFPDERYRKVDKANFSKRIKTRTSANVSVRLPS